MGNGISLRMRNYWAKRSVSFAQHKKLELHSAKAALWRKELLPHLPARGPILDLGCGSGFLTLLLAQEGYEVVGIDFCEEMLVEARAEAKKLGLSVEFLCMDAQTPQFSNGYFSALVSRNLTWALPDLGRAYRNWRALLEAGGLLLNIDADYCHEQQGQQRKTAAHDGVDAQMMDEYEALKLELAPLQERRPDWDLRLLQEAGFTEIVIDRGIWQRIYPTEDLFYNPTPIFALRAVAPQEVS